MHAQTDCVLLRRRHVQSGRPDSPKSNTNTNTTHPEHRTPKSNTEHFQVKHRTTQLRIRSKLNIELNTEHEQRFRTPEQRSRPALLFDSGLFMREAVDAIIKKARPKLKSLMRTVVFYDLPDMVIQYRTHILSLVECHTGAIYHTCDSTLREIDKLQDDFLQTVGLNDKDAFLNWNLAPLALRRDIAILGFLHKCNLRLTHPSVCDFFRVGQIAGRILPAGSGLPHRHTRPMESHRSLVRFQQSLYERSILNMVNVYNLLPQAFVEAPSVTEFQSKLTAVCREKCKYNDNNWKVWLNARGYALNTLASNDYFILR